MCNERFQELFKSNQPRLFRFALRLTRSEERAKDLIQDTALQAFKKRSALEDSSKFHSWINTILYNTFLANYRKLKRRRELMETNIKPTANSFTRSICTNDGFESLKKGDIETIAKRLRKDTYGAFALYTSGYSYKEIGNHMGVKIGTVKSRIHSARQTLATQCRQLGIAS